jgi:hypothetical protein
MTARRRSKLDAFGMSMLVAGGTLFLVAAACLLVSLFFYTVPGVAIPEFTLLEFGTFAGIAGMLVIPLFLVSAVINLIRDRRNTQTGNDIDEDHTERGAAGRR